MYTAICVLLVIASILLVLIVLVQNSKGGGLAANFAAGNQTFGVRQTADYLEKATWTLAIIVLALCLLGTVSAPRGGKVGSSAVQQQMQNTQPVAAPGSTMQFPLPSESAGQEQTQETPPAQQPAEEQPQAE